MFENCTNLESLNKERIELIRSGNPSIVVNKEYAKKKALILSGHERDFKKLNFISKKVVPQEELITGIDNVWWEDETPYRIYVEEI